MRAEDNKVKHYYLHADLDAFFASVEQLDHPEYRGKPVIVGGKPQDKRSVVSTASYEARVFGVHSAMSTAKAYQLCPQGIFVHGRMKRYSELSYQIMQIFSDFSPDVQQMSIDEAFIDLTGTEKLFGPPETTAYKIKERVKKETGLTVSIGLAPTKYLAKLASDMKKPDGFYMIKEGDEENFMLNLPLKKVWGIGDKTYEALRSAGLKTTRDIHEKSLEALTFMYGPNTGTFLYNVVRGIESVSFNRETKSHSISNETTFPFDLTDAYTAETAMLDLCHSVIFRLLKEEGFSRTVQVKIRYEDFSTVSIQQTYSQSILTLDSLYSAAKELFEKKYERGRGIRLLGIALENIEKTERSWQPGLFEDNDEKKQNVEKAILKLEKKHPEIKIHKARMLEKMGKAGKVLIAAFLMSLLNISNNSISLAAQEKQDKESTYQISGSWSGQMKGSIDSTFGMGNPFGISARPPVFDTEVDLSALINITPHFFFEMEFLDKFYNNTYTLGYKGDGYLKLFKFSNRMVTFPTEYSASLNGYGISGGKNEAPGIMLGFEDFENQKWKGDFLLRYDMTEEKSALFYGNNSVQDTATELYSFSRSKAFVIPSNALYHIQNIYIESNNGSLVSNDGKKFYQLSSNDFFIDTEKKLLLLSDSINNLITGKTNPYILLLFDDDSYCHKLLQDTGSYSDPASFAGQVQEFFNTSAPELNLYDYSHLDEASLTINLRGRKAFIIQSPDSFLPYLCANNYKVSSNQTADYLIKDRNSQTLQVAYSVELQSDFYFTLTDYFDEKLSFARVKNLNYPQGQADYLSPAYRFPFADKYPQVYLQEKPELELVFTERTISPVKQFDIGKKASASTVRVYKNGILLAGALYDPNTGFVNLNEPVGELDKIYIVYEEEGSDSSKGFVTTGAGYSYSILPSLVFDTSFTGKYQCTTSLKDLSKTSFSAMTNGLTYKGKFLQAYDGLSAAIETRQGLANSFVTKNQAGLELQNSQGFLKADSSQGIAIDTKSGKKSSDYINTNIKGDYTLFEIKSTADAAFSYLDLQSAGHSITTQKSLFKFLDFGELYRFAKNELDKKDYITLSLQTNPGFTINAQTRAESSSLTDKQNYYLQSGSQFKSKNTSHSAVLSFTADQQNKVNKTSQQSKPDNSNYFTGWYQISKQEFSDGKNAQTRSLSIFSQYKSSFKFLNLSPDISFELAGKKEDSEEEKFITSDNIKFILPFSTQNNAFSFSFNQRGNVSNKSSLSQDYGTDIKQIFSEQKNFDFFYTSIPFYNLFDRHYKNKIMACKNDTSAALEYDFIWRRRLFNDIKDLFIPISLSSGFGRDIIKKANTLTDTWQIKAKLSSNFINLFGSNSLLKYFDWYKQEEYTGFLSAIFKFSPDSKASPSFQISAGEMLTIFIKDTDTLNINNDFYIDNYTNWIFKSSAAWNRSTDKSLLLALTNLCWKKSQDLNLNPKVKDSVSISLSTQNKIHKEVYSYLRTSQINFLTHFDLTSAAGLSFGYEEGKTFRLGLNYEMGLKISF